MISGFNIITAVNEKFAQTILELTGAKVSKYSYNTPINNAIRGICINNANGQYYLRVIVNAGVLIKGKETKDIEFEKDPDFSLLDEKFKTSFAEIIGKKNVEKIPSMRDWTLWIVKYGIDLKVKHINELMHVFRKTDISMSHLIPYQLTQNCAIENNKPKLSHIYDAGKSDRKLMIYSRAGMLKSGLIDYKGTIDDKTVENDSVIRLSLINKRSDMGLAKRFLTKFEMDLGHLDAFLYPLVVTNTFIKAYQDSIGCGDFYKYEGAIQIIEKEVPNFNNRKRLINLINIINEKGSVSKARFAATRRKEFQKDLKLMRDIGINGALLKPDSQLDYIRNPFDELYYKCSIYSS